MATLTERQIQALTDRLDAVEERLNTIQTMMGNSVASRELNGIRIILEDTIKVLANELSALTATVSVIKQRLRIT